MVSEKKYFTPKTAKKTLPLVKKIVEDILAEGQSVKRILEYKSVTLNDDIVKTSLNKIQNYINELLELGCYFKDWDFEVGLVDFPAMINGEEVFLCWKSDEVTLLYYHSISEGFKGRKLIPEEYYID